MDVTKCKLYKIVRKRDLYKVLRINRNININSIITYSPYIAISGKKSRIIEPAYNTKLKVIQKRIQTLLKDIEVDKNIFSGIPGKSYIDNGIFHLGAKYIVALDLSKFFPSIHREKVYNFFKNDLNCSSDVSKILTDLCTINLDGQKKVPNSVFEYLRDNKIKSKNHIPTGSSISSILSYLVNYKMFEDVGKIASKYNCKMSVYVDDIVLSSENEINKNCIREIIAIIRKNGYKIQKKKLKYYNENDYKRVTGNILDKDGKKLVVPNKIKYKIIRSKNDKKIDDQKKKRKLAGYKNVIDQIKRANVQ